MQKHNGKVQISGKMYATVARRLAEFRQNHPIEEGWCIETKCIDNASERIVFKAVIKNPDGKIVATGHAEEKRGSSQVNRSFALENAETGAVGRALKQAGFTGQKFVDIQTAKEKPKVTQKQQEQPGQPKQQNMGWENALVPKELLPPTEREKPIKWAELIFDTAKIQGKNKVFSGAQYLHILENWENNFITSQPEIQGRIKAALRMREKVKAEQLSQN